MNTAEIFQLETPNLLLYIPTVKSAQAMVDLLINNREHLKHSSPNYDDLTRIDFWEKRFETAANNFKNKIALSFLIKHKSEDSPIIGDVNFDGIIRGIFQACYLGFRLDKNYEGKGLMGEALTAAINYLFLNWGLHRIMANFQPDNFRSGNLLKRLGFQREGYAEKYLYIDGVWRDHIMTALINYDHKFF